MQRTCRDIWTFDEGLNNTLHWHPHAGSHPIRAFLPAETAPYEAARVGKAGRASPGGLPRPDGLACRWGRALAVFLAGYFAVRTATAPGLLAVAAVVHWPIDALYGSAAAVAVGFAPRRQASPAKQLWHALLRLTAPPRYGPRRTVVSRFLVSYAHASTR
jgi:hypothetical protein